MKLVGNTLQWAGNIQSTGDGGTRRWSLTLDCEKTEQMLKAVPDAASTSQQIKGKKNE